MRKRSGFLLVTFSLLLLAFYIYPHRVYYVFGGRLWRIIVATKNKKKPRRKKLIISRLNRISGQINGITKMVENDTYCNDVLIQLSAVKNAIKSLSSHILENHLYMCVTRDLENGELDTIDELISLFKRFNQ